MDLFDFTIALSFILILIAIVLKINESSNKINDMENTSFSNQPQYSNNHIPSHSNYYLPYRRKYLLTKTEYAFYNSLKPICDTYNLLICPKVRLEDLAEVTTKNNKMKYRGYIKSRHVDFIICDSALNVIAAIELDDYSHNTAKAQQVDNFKNNFFQAISIPLFRIIVCNNYDGQLSNVIASLGLVKPALNNNNSIFPMGDIINNKLNNLIDMQNALIKEQNDLVSLIKEQSHSS